VAVHFHSCGSISCSLGLHLVTLRAVLFALTLAARLARTQTSKLCFSNMVTSWSPRGPVFHPRMARLNVLNKKLVTLFALCFAMRISLPNSGNTIIFFLAHSRCPPPREEHHLALSKGNSPYAGFIAPLYIWLSHLCPFHVAPSRESHYGQHHMWEAPWVRRFDEEFHLHQ
jgi:hypothetical protein